MAATPSPYRCCWLLVLAASCNQTGLAPPSASSTVPAIAQSSLADDVVASVQVSKVEVPVSFNVPYAGAAKREFAEGLPLSVGSGLRLAPRGGSRCLSERDATSGYSLLGLSDRGPNADAPSVFDGAGVRRGSKSFLAVDFAPQLVTIDVNSQGSAHVRNVVPLRNG
ncbi:MAG TPA: hypothetical protein VGC79_22515, partial [Polyangiaceae bacterium]